MLMFFFSYLFCSGPGGADTILKLSSFISAPDSLIGPLKSLPEFLSDRNEFPLLWWPTGNEPALSMLVLISESVGNLLRRPTIKQSDNFLFKFLAVIYLQFKMHNNLVSIDSMIFYLFYWTLLKPVGLLPQMNYHLLHPFQKQ